LSFFGFVSSAFILYFVFYVFFFFSLFFAMSWRLAAV